MLLQHGEPVWIYPRITDAFVIESIVAGAVIFIGAIGFIILYQSTKHIYNTRYARMLIAVGFILATATFIILQYIIIQAKTAVKTKKRILWIINLVWVGPIQNFLHKSFCNTHFTFIQYTYRSVTKHHCFNFLQWYFDCIIVSIFQY